MVSNSIASSANNFEWNAAEHTLTLEILAPYIDTFGQSWPDGARLLRYLLTWRMTRDRIPRTAAAEIIGFADRYNSGMDKDRNSFRDLPAWRNAAWDDSGRMKWRLSTSDADMEVLQDAVLTAKKEQPVRSPCTILELVRRAGFLVPIRRPSRQSFFPVTLKTKS